MKLSFMIPIIACCSAAGIGWLFGSLASRDINDHAAPSVNFCPVDIDKQKQLDACEKDEDHWRQWYKSTLLDLEVCKIQREAAHQQCYRCKE